MKNYLTPIQRKTLFEELRRERDHKSGIRIRVILLLDDGKTCAEIASFLYLNDKTVRSWKEQYDTGGIDRLFIDNHKGRVAFLNCNQRAELEKELDSKVYSRTSDICKFIKEQFGISYSLSGVTSLLHRMSYSFKKPKGMPAKASVELQKKFLRTYKAIKSHGLVYFGDATHPMLNPILSSGWIKKGKDFHVKTNSGRQRVNINGAIEISSKKVITQTCKTINQAAMRSILRAIRRKNSDAKKIYLILDNAPYNHAKSVKILAQKLGIRLIYLPPYSPNLNPIERLWKFMKKKIVANRYYECLDDYKKSITQFFRSISKYHTELSSLINDNFEIIQHA